MKWFYKEDLLFPLFESPSFIVLIKNKSLVILLFLFLGPVANPIKIQIWVKLPTKLPLCNVTPNNFMNLKQKWFWCVTNLPAYHCKITHLIGIVTVQIFSILFSNRSIEMSSPTNCHVSKRIFFLISDKKLRTFFSRLILFAEGK